mgnify:FL=1
MSKVQFLFHDRSSTLIQRNNLKIFITELFKREGATLRHLTYVFCSDEYLLGINKQFLNHDFYTDIITFDLSSQEIGIKGEVYISMERIKENASKHKTAYKDELHRVIFHGALHLCGYKDKKKIQIEKMRMKEDEYLMMYFE